MASGIVRWSHSRGRRGRKIAVHLISYRNCGSHWRGTVPVVAVGGGSVAGYSSAMRFSREYTRCRGLLVLLISAFLFPAVDGAQGSPSHVTGFASVPELRGVGWRDSMLGGASGVDTMSGSMGFKVASASGVLRQERMRLELSAGDGGGGIRAGGGGGGAWDVRTGLYMDGDQGVDRRKKTVFMTGATGAIGRWALPRAPSAGDLRRVAWHVRAVAVPRAECRCERDF